MNVAALVGALVGHLVGDYLLQNDWMALHKKDYGLVGEFRCAVHCVLWTVAVCVFAGWSLLPHVGSFYLPIILFVTHFAQDRGQLVARWMDAIGQKQFRTGPCAPWSSIVVDNVWHIVTIYFIWSVLAR